MTIIQYSDTRPHEQNWPRRIVSPTRASACCHTGMRTVGHPHLTARYSYQYQCCVRCGFAVRRIVAEFPDQAAVNDARAALARVFSRKPYSYVGAE